MKKRLNFTIAILLITAAMLSSCHIGTPRTLTQPPESTTPPDNVSTTVTKELFTPHNLEVSMITVCFIHNSLQ